MQTTMWSGLAFFLFLTLTPWFKRVGYNPVDAFTIVFALGLVAMLPLTIRFFKRSAFSKSPMRGRLSERQALTYGAGTGIVAGTVFICVHFGQLRHLANSPMVIVLSLIAVPIFSINFAILFHGWLQSRLSSRFGSGFAAVATVGTLVLLFGRSSVIEACAWFAMALGTAMLRRYTGSLLACVVTYATGTLMYAIAGFVALELVGR